MVGHSREIDAFVGCIACNCNVAGSIDLQCNTTRHCDCKANVDGMQCDKCSNGSFNLDAGNPDGCEGISRMCSRLAKLSCALLEYCT